MALIFSLNRKSSRRRCWREVSACIGMDRATGSSLLLSAQSSLSWIMRDSSGGSEVSLLRLTFKVRSTGSAENIGPGNSESELRERSRHTRLSRGFPELSQNGKLVRLRELNESSCMSGPGADSSTNESAFGEVIECIFPVVLSLLAPTLYQVIKFESI